MTTKGRPPTKLAPTARGLTPYGGETYGRVRGQTPPLGIRGMGRGGLSGRAGLGSLSPGVTAVLAPLAFATLLLRPAPPSRPGSPARVSVRVPASPGRLLVLPATSV